MPNDRPTPSMEGKKSGNSITPGESGTVAASGGADRSPRRSRSGARPRLRRARAAVRSETGECPGPGRPAEGEYRETPESAGERQGPSGPDRRATGCRLAIRNLRQSNSIRGTAYPDPGAGRQPPRSVTERIRPRAGSPGRSPVRLAPETGAAGKRNRKTGIPRRTGSASRSRPGTRRTGASRFEESRQSAENSIRRVRSLRIACRGHRPRFEPPRITTRALAVVVGLEGGERGRPAPARPRLRPAPGRSRREGESKALYPPENGLGFRLPAGGAADRRLRIRGVPAVRGELDSKSSLVTDRVSRAPTSVRTTADHDPGARRRRRSRGRRTRPAGSRAAPSSSGAGPQPPGRGIEGPVSPGERARLPAPGRRRGGPAPPDSRSPGSPGGGGPTSARLHPRVAAETVGLRERSKLRPRGETNGRETTGGSRSRVRWKCRPTGRCPAAAGPPGAARSRRRRCFRPR